MERTLSLVLSATRSNATRGYNRRGVFARSCLAQSRALHDLFIASIYVTRPVCRKSRAGRLLKARSGKERNYRRPAGRVEARWGETWVKKSNISIWDDRMATIVASSRGFATVRDCHRADKRFNGEERPVGVLICFREFCADIIGYRDSQGKKEIDNNRYIINK